MANYMHQPTHRMALQLPRACMFDTQNRLPLQMAHRTGFHFFELPRELRDLIYHFLWLGVPDLIVPYLGRKSLIRYDATNGVCSKPPDQPWNRMELLPSWLFLGKAFFEECVTALNERSEWIWLPYGAYRPTAGSAALFGPSTAKIVTVRFREYEGSNAGPIIASTRAEQLRNDTVMHVSVYVRSTYETYTDFVPSPYQSRIAEDMSASGKPTALHLWFNLDRIDTPGELRGFFNLTFGILGPFQYANIATLVIHALDEDVNPLVASPGGLKNLRLGMRTIATAVFGCTRAKIEHEEHWVEEDAILFKVQHWYRTRPASPSEQDEAQLCA